jgi:citrate/tricarballylate utilization protein
MRADELLEQGRHVMTVCNACRYCEAFCPVFPAMEQRLTFSKGDLAYLANLCHNCGECLYACQYAPPHEFGINVPRTLAHIRSRSYEEYCWPKHLGTAFEHHALATTVSLAAGPVAILFAASAFGGNWWGQAYLGGDFYQVVPHGAMVALFGGVSIIVITAIVIGWFRFWRDVDGEPSRRERRAVPRPRAAWAVTHNYSLANLEALWEAATLKHLHGSGVDCVTSLDQRGPWRRWLHHLTFYGFAFCFASTSVAALYHLAFGWRAPYAYTSLPVALGTLGGVGLVIGPLGLMILGRMRDEALGDPQHSGLDVSFAALLAMSSVTGLLLLVLRESRAMGALLILHLGVVLALFLTLPYGKFVHGIYRTAALIKYARETPTSKTDA